MKNIMIDPFKFDDDPKDRVDMVNKLVVELQQHNVTSISAPEIGINVRLFVLKSADPIVCFNPRIVDEIGEITLPEGCYSHPGTSVKITRPESIRMRCQDINGQVQTLQFGGITARSVQHEIDHLNGVDFLDKASYYHKEQAKRKAKKMKRMIKKVK